jgi:Flp pilus assembly protein TadG
VLRVPDRSDAGAAVVDFVLVSVVLLGLFLGVVQLGVALHVRNTLVAAAAEGARFGANADRSAVDGELRTRDLVSASLSSGMVQEVAAGYEDVAGTSTVVVEIRARLPLVGLLGPARGLVVRGHAFAEAQP